MNEKLLKENVNAMLVSEIRTIVEPLQYILADKRVSKKEGVAALQSSAVCTAAKDASTLDVASKKVHDWMQLKFSAIRSS